MEALPLYLGKLMPEHTAIIVSVTCVLFFGEIIPQAIATSSLKIRLAELCCPIVMVTMYLIAPLSWPLGKLLDKMTGHEGHDAPKRYTDKQLEHVLNEHVKQYLPEELLDQDRSLIGTESLIMAKKESSGIDLRPTNE
jgi:metal transporter CNNM